MFCIENTMEKDKNNDYNENGTEQNDSVARDMKGDVMNMNKRELTEKVKRLIYGMGADMVGIAPISRFDGQSHMLHPLAHLPEAKSVICFGIHHPDASVEFCGEPNPNFPQAFQIGMIPKLDTMCYRVAKMLEKEGYPTVAQPCTTYWRHRRYKDIPYEHAATFSHMAAFVACGLGEYGYHGMVLSPEYGPRERIISLITSAELEYDPLYEGDPLCDGCMMCAKHCIGLNYSEDKLNDPKFIEFEIEGKKFRYPNINRWRCFYGEQAHLDTTKLPEFIEMDEEAVCRATETVPRVPNRGYMCRSFKYCMTKGKRYFDKKYAPGARRKKGKSDLPLQEILDTIVKMAADTGAEYMHIEPLANFAHLKPNFEEGFRTEDFFRCMTSVVTFGRTVYNYRNDIPLEKRNRLHIERPTDERMASALIDVTRYLDDLGYEAIQDWWSTGISSESMKRANLHCEGKRIYAVSVICNLPFESQTRVIREWDLPGLTTLDSSHPIFENVETVTVGSLDGIELEGIEEIRALYPDCKSIVALGCEIPERTVELACNQEAEDGGPYAYMHYEILKECIWAGEDLCSSLEKQGYFAVTLADLVPDSYLTIGKLGRHMPDLAANAPFAAAAGLGSVGKSGMLVRPDCGPRMRYVFVLTDAPLTPTAHKAESLCPTDCSACVTACPMNALSGERTKTVCIRGDERYEVLMRDENRCMWSRSLALCEGAGAGQLGWIVPKLEVPDVITPERIDEALQAKDRVQTLCYRNPNFTDIIVERCLQACPIGKKGCKRQ